MHKFILIRPLKTAIHLYISPILFLYFHNFTIGVVEAASSSLVTQTKKALETLRFPMLFSYPVTQFFADCYTNCCAADGQLPTTDDHVAHHSRDRQTVLVAQP